MEVDMNPLRHFAAPVAALSLGVGIVGCSSEPKAEQVPPGAQLLVQGDQQLSYTAQRDGEVYVYDANDRTLLYSGQIEKGQTVAIDPDEDKIMVDNRLVLEKDIHAGNRHRIYFQENRSARRDDARVIERSTEVREERTAGERLNHRSDADTIRREERRTVETKNDGDVTVKKETTIKAD
jgi:hypothetical protein